MKKLKIKVFITIFSILSVFILIVLIVNNYQNYHEQDMHIKEVLLGHIFDKNIMNNHDIVINNQIDDKQKIFIDSDVYTIILDDDGNYKEMINHTPNEIDEEKIKIVANEIVNNHTEKVYIGNLYLTNYAYAFMSNNKLVIIDCTFSKNNLLNNLLISIISFFVLETIVYFVAYYLTRWITKPVHDSFIRQERFVADASHELKTPLAVIVASLDAYNNDKDEKWIKNIKNESERMNKLITNLLDLAKTDGDNQIIKKSENISNIVESTILTFESLFYEKKIKLDYKIKENIMFNCNQDQIKQLLGILIDNAIKYSDKLGKVIITLNTDNKNIILQVKNSGAPISDDDKEKIFDRFYKLDSSRNRNNNNYGLGLAIAKNIVEGHGGHISASSKDGMTTFMVIWNQK